MKILSIIAQKPDFTGSGIYLRELVKCFDENNIEQATICGISKNDDIKPFETKKYTGVYPVYFNEEKLPFDVVGMSDEMPYKSTKYIDLLSNEMMIDAWKKSFSEKILDVYDSFKPDLIICHHLYLLTALTRELLKDAKIHAICHNTDLRQFVKVNRLRAYISDNIKKIDKIFAPSEEHKKQAIELLGLDEKKVEVVGIGYNDKIFYNTNKRKENECTRFMYAGKIAKKKGVLSLVKAFKIYKEKFVKNKVSLDLIGGAGNEEEYLEIKKVAEEIGDIRFISKLNQVDLAKEYNNHNIFILPSFTEGISMVVIEALACGMKVVTSDLPGLRDFVKAHVDNACVEYVTLPKLTEVDNATEEELRCYESRLAEALSKITQYVVIIKPILHNISWMNIAKQISKVNL